MEVTSEKRGRKKTMTYCLGGPGIIFSRRTLKGNVAYCNGSFSVHNLKII